MSRVTSVQRFLPANFQLRPSILNLGVGTGRHGSDRRTDRQMTTTINV